VDTGPALPEPGRDEDPPGLAAGPDDFPAVGSDRWRLLPSSADWPDWSQDEAYLAALAEEDEPDDPDLYQDPDNAPPPGLDDAQLAELIAEAGRDGLTPVTTEKDLVRLRKTEGARAIVAFPVTLEFGDAALFRKFVADALFRSRQKRFRTGS